MKPLLHPIRTTRLLWLLVFVPVVLILAGQGRDAGRLNAIL